MTRYSQALLVAATQIAAGAGACSGTQPSQVSTTEQPVTINYYVSPTGMGNQCKSSSPCTIATAKAKVQAAAPTMSGDINVRLKTGTYVLTAPLTFGPTDSGRNGYSVVWQADAGATPVISGQRTITGWSLHDAPKNIWRATATALNTRQLYVNGVRAERARSISEPLKYKQNEATSPSEWFFTASDNLELVNFTRPTDLEISRTVERNSATP